MYRNRDVCEAERDGRAAKSSRRYALRHTHLAKLVLANVVLRTTDPERHRLERTDNVLELLIIEVEVDDRCVAPAAPAHRRVVPEINVRTSVLWEYGVDQAADVDGGCGGQRGRGVQVLKNIRREQH